MKSGRPPNFAGPRHPITVTLPEDTLARLASVDSDRARAIVKVTAVAMSADPNRQKQVELQEVSPGLAIIIVGPSRLLRRIEWLRLVQVAPMRFLLSIPVGTSVSALELAILELLDEESSDHEHSLLIELRDLIRSRR
ncbi:MAG TPA: hypothetical protein VHP35_05765, partial [Terriglobia bacterium]|nr:hypothetical protein [Terriglobia bacterium]